MHVLITGGTGTLGSAVARTAIASGLEVSVLGRRRGEVRLDLTESSRSSLRAALTGVDAVVHAAAAIRGSPKHLDALNVSATVRLVEASIGRISRFIYVSSTGRYGSPRADQVDETYPANPRTAYESTKALAEEHVNGASRTGLLSAATVQPSTVVAPGGNVIARLARAASRGVPLPGHARGAVLNAVALPDVAESILSLLNSDLQGTYILSQPCPWDAIYDGIAEGVDGQMRVLPTFLTPLLGKVGDLTRLPFSSEAAATMTARTRFDSSKARSMLGFEPLATSDLIARALQA